MAYTDVDNSTNYFRVKIYNGDGTDDRNITWDESSNMQPDMLWSKRRDSADNYSIYDIVRGSGLELRTNTYTVSSGNADGNGYGNFEYSVPSGYYALNTKNLAEYG